MQASHRFKFPRWRVLLSLIAGALTTELVVCVAVVVGPPQLKWTYAVLSVFRFEDGWVFEQERHRSFLTTRTYAGFVQGLSRPGRFPGTVQVLSQSEEYFSVRQRTLLKQAGFEPISHEEQDDPLDADMEAELKRIDELTVQPLLEGGRFEYTQIQKSPLHGAAFSSEPEANLVDEFTLGFPFRSRWTADWTDWRRGGCFQTYHGSTNWIASNWKKSNSPWVLCKKGITAEYGFPTGFLPLGFAANTTIYFVAWFGLLSIPAFIRRSIAKRKYLCPKCRYDLRGLTTSAPCPECGATQKSE